MARRWVIEAIKDSLEEAKREGDTETVKELEQLLKKREERGVANA